MPDTIDHPPHYAAGRRFEPIDVIEDWRLGFCDGNVVKYLSRWRSKGGIEDLKKAAWYLQRFIEQEERRAAAPAIRGRSRDEQRRAAASATSITASPAPSPLPEDGPRERSAQPAPPPAPDPGPSAPTPRGPEARAPAPDLDGLAPEAGCDPGPIPEALRRSV